MTIRSPFSVCLWRFYFLETMEASRFNDEHYIETYVEIILSFLVFGPHTIKIKRDRRP